ncbi:MAG: LysR family transcriptional regulator [Polyangiaceae bacterium]|nr:LysR family transcriptional regulator [Polyangiaceae bacterium]
MDRLESMRVFVAVAEARGFASAARRLGMSPPAVTRAVAAIEDHLGAQLLRRTTRVVRLTDAGERYLHDTRKILASIEDAEATAAGSHAELRGPITITAPVMFGQRHVAPVILEFAAKHPLVEMRARLADKVVDLIEDEADIAIRIAQLDPESLEIGARVGEVRRVCCASVAYLSKHGIPKTPADISSHRVISFSHRATPADWGFVEGEGHTIVRPSFALVTNSTELSVAAALAGHGITRALSYQVAEEVRKGSLRLLLEPFEPPPLPIFILYRDGPRAPARVRAFVKFATTKLRQDAALTRFGRR